MRCALAVCFLALAVLFATPVCAKAANNAPYGGVSPIQWIGSQLDISGVRATPKSIDGAVVCVFFFCGCPQCHKVASSWAEAVQNDDDSAQGKTRPLVLTVVSFDGSASEAKQFINETGLYNLHADLIVQTRYSPGRLRAAKPNTNYRQVPARASLVQGKTQLRADHAQNDLNFPMIVQTDPGEKLRLRFGIMSCPHAYVFNRLGQTVYSTKPIADTQATSALKIISQVLTAERSARKSTPSQKYQK